MTEKLFTTSVIAILILAIYGLVVYTLLRDTKLSAASGSVANCVELAKNNEAMARAQFNFELIYGALKDTFADYKNIVWSSFGFLIVAIGWILTSEKSRIFLHRVDSARHWALVAVGAIAAIHVIVLTETYYDSQAIMELLSVDKYVHCADVMRTYYALYEVKPYFLPFSMTINGVMFIFLFKQISALKDWKEPKEN